MKRIGFSIAFVTILWTAVFSQPTFYAYDADNVICVGLSRDYGYFGIELTGGEWLTYYGCTGGGAATSHTNFYVDDVVYSADPYGPGGSTPIVPIRTEYDPFENIIIVDWLPIPDVQFTQILFPFSVDSAGAVLVRYTIINRSTVDSHDVGVLLLLDINVDGVDDAPTHVPGAVSVIESTLVFGSASMPPYLQLYNHDPFDTTFPEDELIAARLQLEGAPTVAPDWVAIGNQRTLADIAWPWRPSMPPIEKIEDVADLLVWGHVRIGPSSAITFATSYGVAPEGLFAGGAVGTRIEVPHNLRVQHCDLIPNPLTFSALYRNNCDSTLTNVTSQLEFVDDCFIMDPSDGAITIADTLLPSEVRTLAWTVSIPDTLLPSESRRYRILLINCAESTGTSGTMSFCDTIVDSIFVQGSTYHGPYAEIIYPLPGTFTSNFFQPIAIYLTDDDTAVSALSIRLEIITLSGDVLYTIRPGLVGCTYTNDTLYWPNEIAHASGDVLRFRLSPTYDLHGCPLPETLYSYFVYDITPPVFLDYFPYEGEILNDSLLVPWLKIVDYINRVDSNSVDIDIITNEGERALCCSDPLLNYYPADTLFRLEPFSDGWRWPDGDVTITLNSVCDAPDYGAPNCATGLTYSWTFTMNSHGPRAYPRTPLDGWYVSIPNPNIVFHLYDGNGINVSTVRYNVDGTIYNAPAGFGTHDSILTHVPSTGWPNGHNVAVAITQANDVLGTPFDAAGSYPSWDFTIDIQHPVICWTSIEPFDTIHDPMPTIQICLTDSLSGIVTSSIALLINGVSYTLSDPSLSYAGSMLTWNASAAGVYLDGSTSLCVRAIDRPDLGSPNELDSCFTFYVRSAGPAVSFMFDYNILCGDYVPINMRIIDPDGVDENTIVIRVNTETIEYPSPSLVYNDASGILTYTPFAPWTDGAVVPICVQDVADDFGVAIESPVCTTFVVDLRPPDTTSVTFEKWYHVPPGLPPGHGVHDSVAFYFAITNSYGLLDTNETIVRIYNATSGALLWEFNIVEDPDVVWFDGSRVVFWSGTAAVLTDGTTYRICLSLSEFCYGGPREVEYCVNYFATEIEEPVKLPTESKLLPNFPDPFNAATIIPVQMGQAGYAKVDIMSIDGRTIKTLWEGNLNAGISNLRWDGKDNDGRDTPSGVFFVRLQANLTSQVSRLMLIK